LHRAKKYAVSAFLIRPAKTNQDREFLNLDHKQGRPDHFKTFWAKDSGSEMQMRDVQNLVATGCDAAYIDNWTRELGLFNLWQQCRQ
jgi:hypothetical protein